MKHWKLIATLIGISVFLFILVLVMIGRNAMLRNELTIQGTAKALPEADQIALQRFHQFIKVMQDLGWKVVITPEMSNPGNDALQVQRALLESTIPDQDGQTHRLAIDALTFASKAPLLDSEDHAFDYKTWPALHLSAHLEEKERPPTRIVRQASTAFVFYLWGASATLIPDTFQEFINANEAGTSAIKDRLAKTHQEQLAQYEAVKIMQEAFAKTDVYDGNVDGAYGWQTKKALQRFLQKAGFYSGGIDGVFGSGTRQALAKFREDAGIPAEGGIDQSLAEAITKAAEKLDAPPEEPATTGEPEI